MVFELSEDALGAGAAISAVADEISQVLNEFDRPICTYSYHTKKSSFTFKPSILSALMLLPVIDLYVEAQSYWRKGEPAYPVSNRVADIITGSFRTAGIETYAPTNNIPSVTSGGLGATDSLTELLGGGGDKANTLLEENPAVKKAFNKKKNAALKVLFPWSNLGS